MINDIIRLYLSSNKRLVIPEFGTFIRKDTGEIVFVEFLKKDDQVLTSLVSKTYSVPESDARTIVSQYITHIKQQTNSGNSYFLPGIGNLALDSSGILNLDFNPSATPVQKSDQPTSPKPAEQIIRTEGVIDSENQQQTISKPAPEQAVRIEAPAPIDQQEQRVPPPSPGRPLATQQPIRQTPQNTPNRVEDQTKTEPIRERIITTTPSKANTLERNSNRPPSSNNPKKKKADIIIIIAIVAALLALVSMFYGIFVDSDPISKLRPTSPQEELVVTDTIPSNTAEQE